MLRTFVLIALLTLGAGSAPALQEPVNFGARVGYTSWDDVHQMHVGGHAILAEIFPNVDYTPSLEVGLGDDLTLLTLNNDLTYRFTELTTAPWGLYGGGGLGLHRLQSDDRDGDAELGLSAVVGSTYELAGGNRLRAEVRIGLMDTPDLKLTIGYTFAR
ncbi:hypothetical protein CSA17_03505 [bacterium DOLJORAL78_65_58]|nr:MAG: hypothetical protein CSB20_14550 [bacterium DOLZORAL124_64_63]PIE76198.1 MAG: hypothetical protein CSA17_03505 [bacterium DOLJORAL78_65_58]